MSYFFTSSHFKLLTFNSSVRLLISKEIEVKKNGVLIQGRQPFALELRIELQNTNDIFNE